MSIRGEWGGSCEASYDLALEVMQHDVYHMLLVISKTQGHVRFKGKGLQQGHGLLRVPSLETSYHSHQQIGPPHLLDFYFFKFYLIIFLDFLSAADLVDCSFSKLSLLWLHRPLAFLFPLWLLFNLLCFPPNWKYSTTSDSRLGLD